MGMRFARLAGALVCSAALLATSPSFAQETLTIWWSKGFYKSEDDALLAAIKKFEAKTGVKVELSQYAVQDMIPKTVAALDSGTVPDVAYSDTYDVQAGGKWAFEGKLADQDPNDEPASDLLKRIQAERAVSASAKDNGGPRRNRKSQ